MLNDMFFRDRVNALTETPRIPNATIITLNVMATIFMGKFLTIYYAENLHIAHRLD